MDTDVVKGCCYKYMGLGVVAYPCNLSTGKEQQRQEDYEFKGSLEYISLRPAWLHRDPLSVKLRVGPRKMAQVLRTRIALTGPKSSSLTLSMSSGLQPPGTPVSGDPRAPSGFLEDLHSCVHTPPPRYMHTYNFKSFKTNQGWTWLSS